jgi:hypothetical protein
LDGWKFIRQWTCGWKGDASCWESPIPSDACDRACDSEDNYKPSANWKYCIRDWKCSQEEAFMCIESGEPVKTVSETSEDNYWYYWECPWDRW